MRPLPNILVTLLLALGLAVGFVSTTSCEEDTFDDAPLTAEGRQACADYCLEAKACEDELDMPKCETECENQLQGCFEDQVDEAVDELQECMNGDQCIDVVGCSFEVAQECYFDFGLFD